MPCPEDEVTKHDQAILAELSKTTTKAINALLANDRPELRRLYIEGAKQAYERALRLKDEKRNINPKILERLAQLKTILQGLDELHELFLQQHSSATNPKSASITRPPLLRRLLPRQSP